MFEPEAYQKTAEPFVMFCFLKHRKEMAAEKAEENAKNAKKPKRAKKPARSASSSDEDDDDSADDDDEVDEELAKVGQLADELLAHDLLSAIDKGTLTRGELLKAIALKLPSPGANERLKKNKRLRSCSRRRCSRCATRTRLTTTVATAAAAEAAAAAAADGAWTDMKSTNVSNFCL